MLNTSSFSIGVGLSNALRVDINPDAARSESLRSGNDNPTVTASNVVNDVVSRDFGKRKHALNNIIG